MKTRRAATAVGNRIRSNFFLRDRSDSYETLLRFLKDSGYVSVTMRDVIQSLRSNNPLPNRRVILRHDIDSDSGYVNTWLSIEERFGFPASYYFRLRTLDTRLMERIEASGGEASYHFEELASVIRRRGLQRKDMQRNIIEEARDEFEKNLLALKARCPLPFQTVAAHGDFINRKFGLTNSIVVTDQGLRDRLGILAEAYDEDIAKTIDVRFSDRMGGGWISDGIADPQIAIENNVSSIQILTHPRHWRASIFCNLYEDADRILSSALHNLALPAGPIVDYINRRPRPR